MPDVPGCPSEYRGIRKTTAGFDEIVEVGGSRALEPLFVPPCSPFRLGVAAEVLQQRPEWRKGHVAMVCHHTQRLFQIISGDVGVCADRDYVDEVPPAGVGSSPFDGGHDFLRQDHVYRVSEEAHLTAEQEG